MKKREKGVRKPWRVLIYGKQGDGKTSVTRFAPAPVALLSYDNTDGVLDNVDKNGVVDSYNIENPQKILKETNDFIEEVANSDYKTVVFDNLSALERIWFVNAAIDGKNSDINSLQDYGRYTNQLIKMLTYIDEKLSDKNIVFTAWQTQKEQWLASGQKITPAMPKLRDDLSEYVMGTMNAVTHIKTDPDTKERFWTFASSANDYAKNQIDGRKRASFEDLFKFGDEPEGNDE